MSPRRKNQRDIQDSTTEFFLKIMQKEKEKTNKESITKENLNITKNKTIDKFGHFYNYINQTLDRILQNKISVLTLAFIMAGVLFITIRDDNNLSSPTSALTR